MSIEDPSETGPLPVQRGPGGTAAGRPASPPTSLTPLQALERDYRVAFLSYLPQRREEALHTAYALGRSAVTEGVNILQLAQVHHDVFLEVLRDCPRDELPDVARAASEFFLEVLAVHDMAQRVFLGDR